MERVIRTGLGVFGIAGLAFGAYNLAAQPVMDLFTAGIWFAGPAVASDLVLMPAIAVIGTILTTAVRPWLRLPVQLCLILCGLLTVVALPFLVNPGLRPDNPTLLNRNYLAGWAVYVGLVTAAALVWALVRRRRSANVHRPV